MKLKNAHQVHELYIGSAAQRHSLQASPRAGALARDLQWPVNGLPQDVLHWAAHTSKSLVKGTKRAISQGFLQRHCMVPTGYFMTDLSRAYRKGSILRVPLIPLRALKELLHKGFFKRTVRFPSPGLVERHCNWVLS